MADSTRRTPKRPVGIRRKQKCDRVRKAMARSFETDDQRRARLDDQKLRQAKSRDTETTGQRAKRLKNNRRNSKSSAKANETSDESSTRLAKTRRANKRARESFARELVRLEDDRRRHADSRVRDERRSSVRLADQRDDRMDFALFDKG